MFQELANTTVPPKTLGRRAGEPSTGSPPAQVTHLLLYLCEATWRDERLAQEVAAARAAKLPIVMAYENDAARDGFLVSRFFETTPQELISDGLYKNLAISCFPGIHRQVSLVLLAKALESTVVRRTASARLRESFRERNCIRLRRRRASPTLKEEPGCSIWNLSI